MKWKLGKPGIRKDDKVSLPKSKGDKKMWEKFY